MVINEFFAEAIFDYELKASETNNYPENYELRVGLLHCLVRNFPEIAGKDKYLGVKSIKNILFNQGCICAS